MASTRQREERFSPQSAGPKPTQAIVPAAAATPAIPGAEAPPPTSPPPPPPADAPPPAPGTDPVKDADNKPSLHASHFLVYAPGDPATRPTLYVEVVPKATRSMHAMLLVQCKQRRAAAAYPLAMFVTPFATNLIVAPHSLCHRQGSPVLTSSFGDTWHARDNPDATLLGGTHMLFALAGLQPPRTDVDLAGQVEVWLRKLPSAPDHLLPPAGGVVGLARAWLKASLLRYSTAMAIDRQQGLVKLPYWFEDDEPAEGQAKERKRRKGR